MQCVLCFENWQRITRTQIVLYTMCFVFRELAANNPDPGSVIYNVFCVLRTGSA